MAKLKCNFELFPVTEWKVSRPTICGRLVYYIEQGRTQGGEGLGLKPTP